jgi:chromosome segregation ATPase
MATDDIYVRLNNILDKATESLTQISQERDKQNAHFSNLIDEVKLKNNSLTDKFNKLKNTFRKTETIIIEDLTKIRKEVKDSSSILNSKITELSGQLKDIEGVIELIQRKQNTTEVRISSLESKTKKRKWWKLF